MTLQGSLKITVLCNILKLLFPPHFFSSPSPIPLLPQSHPPHTPSLSSPSIYLRCVWRHAAGGMRGYALAPEQRDDSSQGVRSKQAQQFDWALAKLDTSVRRTGRITKTLLLRIFHDICRTGRLQEH